MPLQKRLYSLGVHKCEWEETFGGLFDRTMAMSRSTVVKISPSDLGAHHIVDFKDQNDKIILNKFTVYTREMGLLSARRRIKFTFFFAAAAAPPTPNRKSVKRLINSSWPCQTLHVSNATCVKRYMGQTLHGGSGCLKWHRFC